MRSSRPSSSSLSSSLLPSSSTTTAMPMAVQLILLLISAVVVGASEQMEQMSSLESIATGSGRILRPTRSDVAAAFTDAGESPTEDSEADDVAAQAMPMKRSLSLGRNPFRPGKWRFLPITGAFAHDPLNQRYEFLFMDGNAEQGTNAPKDELKQQFKLVRPMRFRLLPATNVVDADEVLADRSEIFEASMGKRSSLASGRIGFRPAKRSMAVGRTGFRPGKRSIATGRVRFRPGKRSLPAEEEIGYLWLQ